MSDPVTVPIDICAIYDEVVKHSSMFQMLIYTQTPVNVVNINAEVVLKKFFDRFECSASYEIKVTYADVDLSDGSVKILAYMVFADQKQFNLAKLSCPKLVELLLQD